MTLETRDQIFRERLVELIVLLKGPEGHKPGFRNRIGALATKMARDAGARNWSDLKARADGPTYDSMLRSTNACERNCKQRLRKAACQRHRLRQKR